MGGGELTRRKGGARRRTDTVSLAGFMGYSPVMLLDRARAYYRAAFAPDQGYYFTVGAVMPDITSQLCGNFMSYLRILLTEFTSTLVASTPDKNGQRDSYLHSYMSRPDKWLRRMRRVQ